MHMKRMEEARKLRDLKEKLTKQRAQQKANEIWERTDTAASIHKATNYPIAVSFDAGNLLPVVKNLRSKFPNIELVICADNDSNKEINVGLSKAKEAALAVGALLSIAGVTYG